MNYRSHVIQHLERLILGPLIVSGRMFVPFLGRVQDRLDDRLNRWRLESLSSGRLNINPLLWILCRTYPVASFLIRLRIRFPEGHPLCERLKRYHRHHWSE